MGDLRGRENIQRGKTVRTSGTAVARISKGKKSKVEKTPNCVSLRPKKRLYHRKKKWDYEQGGKRFGVDLILQWRDRG